MYHHLSQNLYIMSRTHRCFLSLSVRKDHIYTDAHGATCKSHTYIHTHTYTK